MAMRNSGFGRGGRPFHGPPYPSPMYRSSPMPPPPPPMSEFGPPRMPPPGPFGSSMGPPPPQGPRMGGRGAGFHAPFNQRFAPYRVPPQKNGIPRPGLPIKSIRKGKPNQRPNSKGSPNKGVQNSSQDTSNGNNVPNKTGTSTVEGGDSQQQDAKEGSESVNNGTSAVTELKVPPDLMEPLYCKLCDIKLNGTLQASAHYEGKSHAKKARQYLDKLRKEKGITAPLPTTNGKSEGKEKKNQPAEMYCKLCDVAFTSDIQAKQHHNGRNHQRRLRGEPPLPKGFYNAATGKWQRQPPAGVAFPSAPQTKKPQEFECTICNSKMTSQAQLDAHLAGAKHRAKVASQTQGTTATTTSVPTNNSYYQNTNTLGSTTPAANNMAFVLPGYTANTGIHTSQLLIPVQNGGDLTQTKPKKFQPQNREYSMYRTPSGKYYCSSCNLSLNSDVQLAQHFSSKKHKAKMATQRRTGTTA